jgi:prepilin-type N-terminal cleavage/methylation domain-containing protein
MSDSSNPTRRDRGFTLPELLISVTLTAVLITAMSSAIVVMLRSADNNLGRTNNARSEQSVGFWMPSDLASAEVVDTAPGRMPCGEVYVAPHPSAGQPSQGQCPDGLVLDGSNTLMLTWTGSIADSSTGNLPVETTTVVSYRYMYDGTGYVLVRVACSWRVEAGGFSPARCDQRTVLEELDAPPSGVTFVAGVTSPDWVIKVTSALGANDTTAIGATIDDPGLTTKNARRVLVTINGGADVDGIGGGRNTFSFSAGGVDRETALSTDDLGGAPSFIAARTRCGGNFGLIMDKSGSIGSEFPTVRNGVLQFIDTFAGKPVRLQVVAFDARSVTVGATGADTWTRYYDMLDPAEVADLKTRVGAINTGGGTNYEDAWFRMLRNPDGSVRSILPDKVIFFTDGQPTRSMLEAFSTGATPPPAHPSDGGLPGYDSNAGYYQKGWSRAARLVIESGATDIVGVLVGPDSENESPWVNAGAGYVWQYEMGSGLTFQQRTGTFYEKGNNVVFERGGSTVYERNNNLLFERGYREVPQRNNNIVFERAQSGVVWERLVGASWSSTSWNTYRSNNSTPDSTDGWRTRVTGTPGNWTSMSSTTQFYATNVTNDSTDGYRAQLSGGLSSNWTDITTAQYSTSNVTADSSDGWRMNRVYSSPFTGWETVTAAVYESGNTSPGDADGWRTRVNGSLSTSWTTSTSSLYSESNTTADSSDGWRVVGSFSPPYTTWATVTEVDYTAGNTVAGDSDGWRSRQTAASTSWTPVAQALYDKSNTTADATDGWRTGPIWTTVSTAAYDAGNTVAGEADGWRPVVPGTPASTWSVVPKSYFDKSNTTADGTDYFRQIKLYPVGAPAYDGFDAYTTENRENERILGDLIAPAGVNKAVYDPVAQSYGDVREVNLFVETEWDRFDDAIRDVALGECGGTVTIQTRSTSGASVLDPFTYSNQNAQTVETSAAYKSGTFDVVLPGASASTIQISPQNLSTLNSWQHVSWTCKSQGVNMTAPNFVVGAPDAQGWRGISLNVSANSAISCVQVVAPK